MLAGGSGLNSEKMMINSAFWHFPRVGCSICCNLKAIKTVSRRGNWYDPYQKKGA